MSENPEVIKFTKNNITEITIGGGPGINYLTTVINPREMKTCKMAHGIFRLHASTHNYWGLIEGFDALLHVEGIDNLIELLLETKKEVLKTQEKLSAEDSV